jgi:pimeloyl-ACP methyl ester carboxylesterase
MFRDGSDPALIERVTHDMCDGSPEIGLALLRQFMVYEMGPALSAVSVPVRYINADRYPTDPEVNMKYQPDFSGIIVENVGHFLMMEKPDVFNELLRQVVEELE